MYHIMTSAGIIDRNFEEPRGWEKGVGRKREGEYQAKRDVCMYVFYIRAWSEERGGEGVSYHIVS